MRSLVVIYYIYLIGHSGTLCQQFVSRTKKHYFCIIKLISPGGILVAECELIFNCIQVHGSKLQSSVQHQSKIS